MYKRCSVNKRYIHTTCGGLIEFVRFGPTDDPRLHCPVCNMSQPLSVVEDAPELQAAYRLGGREAVFEIVQTSAWVRLWELACL